MKTPSHIQQLLEKRRQEDSLRSLEVHDGMIDFCSNNYLGASYSFDLYKAIKKEVYKEDLYNNGSTGSRLLTGNTYYAEDLEKYIAKFHNAEAALIFNSGYDANLGLFSSIAGKDDTIICDELIHASIIDGCRMSYAAKYKFRHNDLEDLKRKISSSKGNVFIAVESVYSMDGDFAPLEDLVTVTESANAFLIVDEAHATGIWGHEGRGLLNELRLEEKVFARLYTFGKAMGVHGAAIVGSQLLKEFLVNYARPFIFSTALSAHSLAAIRCSYEWMRKRDEERKILHDLIALFRDLAKELNLTNSHSPIQPVIIPGNNECRSAAYRVQDMGYDIRPILSPTVPKGKERVRICLHSYNLKEEIDIIIDELILSQKK